MTIFPNAAFYNNYGMTEATPRASWIRDDNPRFLEPTCGKPMDGVEVCVIDPVTHKQLPSGSQGILAIRGPNVTSGYINDEEITRKAFTSDGWLISGDVATIRDGYIYIHGRSDDIFNVGGEKVAPLEIERVLNQHDAIELSGVAGIPDEQRGYVAVAFIKITRPVTRKELVDYLKEWLSPSHIPQRYIEVSSFPMTSNGKMQRRLLSVDDAERVIEEII